MSGELYDCFSFDSAVVDGDIDDDTYSIYFLNSFNPSSHILLLKRGAVVMLLKNLDLVIKNIFRHLLDVEILSGYYRGYLPKMLFQPSDSGFPYMLKRLQFPIRLAFSVTINKPQGQTFDKVGIFLDRPCFFNGQLYVEFSRARAFTDIKVKLWESNEQRYHNGKWYTRDVVIETVLKTCAHPPNTSSVAGISPASSVS